MKQQEKKKAERPGAYSGKSPDIVFTTGDPNGIGPEVTLKAIKTILEKTPCHPIVTGNRVYLEKLTRDIGLSLPWDQLEIVETAEKEFTPNWGRVSEEAGSLAWKSLRAGVQICRERQLPLLVTAPVNKESLRLAGFRFPGQTEFLAETFQAEHYCMAFFSDFFHLLLATIHIPLSQVPRELNSLDLYQKCQLFWGALKKLESSPRVAVCGLNPHASEQGMFGTEEEKIIVPVIKKLQESLGSESFAGPFPPDTIFNHAASGRYSGVVAMYHDQGLIPLKLLAFDKAVNTTLGLPLVRTSPDHGTAFDIAGRFEARPDSMIEAIRWGMRLTGDRFELDQRAPK